MFSALASIANDAANSILSPQTLLDWALLAYVLIGFLVVLTLIFTACGSANVFEIPGPIFFPAFLIVVALWPLIVGAWLFISNDKPPTK